MDIGRHFELSLDEANINEQDFREITWYQCQCSDSSQIPSQDDLNDDRQFLSLYKINWCNDKTELIIYNIEDKKEEVKILDTELIDISTSITQLPNGELFCYGSYKSGIALIIDRKYKIRMLPSGTPSRFSPTHYFDNNIYCFGGAYDKNCKRALSRKFDFEKNRWINLASLPEVNVFCHSVIFNENILISGNHSKNIWLYSIEIDSFSIIPYDFAMNKRKFMINVESLYLIEWDEHGLVYESEDEYHWKPISKSQALDRGGRMYCLYNKEKIYISTWSDYYEFDLKKKFLVRIK